MEISRSKSVVGGAGLLKDVAPWCSVALSVADGMHFLCQRSFTASRDTFVASDGFSLPLIAFRL